VKLLFLTGSRGEWGYIRPILRLAHERGHEARICATNMHLLPSHGLSINEIRADGFGVDDEIYMSLDAHNRTTMAKSLGVFLSSFVDVLHRVRPDWLVLAGDRGEQFMGAVAAAYNYTPTAHIQAGELSGNIDGMARHAIGKLVHLHLAANHDAQERLRRLGEEEFRIHLVGAPQLDELVQGRHTDGDRLRRDFGVDVERPFLLVVQHSVTEEFERAEEQIAATTEALQRFDLPRVWIMPNNDAGSDDIRAGILRERTGQTFLFENLRREDYLGFLRRASCIVGNSSSGLLEAPTFGVPAVNLGRRQADRLRGANVIDAPFEASAIHAAIELACSDAFRASIRDAPNPYGDGHSSARILDLLEAIPRDARLLTKQLTH
jgi:GDP/UDP-N,N'-diacetylbacillosamine 2-epimerase (hydrolysing)